MSTTDEKDNLIGELQDNQKEISELKTQLNLLNEQKEAEFQKREEVGKQISELIRNIKGLKRERDSFTAQVKENKQKRDSLRITLREKITLFKKASEDKTSLLKKSSIKTPPDMIRATIAKMEMRIETEGMSFDKEQKLMKQIKEIRKQLDEAKEIDAVYSEARKLSKEIKDIKNELDVCNANVKNFASQSQAKHEEMLALSKQVDELMAKENEHKERFQKFKDEFSEMNNKLKEKLPQMSTLREKINTEKTESRKKKRDEIEKELKEKGTKVQEKIRRREKLTTKDLLVFQGTAAKEEDEELIEKKEEQQKEQ
ncbi:MAG: hypothetical protein V1866_01865 [archaeon]